MGSEFAANVGEWVLNVDVKDHWVAVEIITNDSPPRTHYVRMTHKQARELRDFLEHSLPIAA